MKQLYILCIDDKLYSAHFDHQELLDELRNTEAWIKEHVLAVKHELGVSELRMTRDEGFWNRTYKCDEDDYKIVVDTKIEGTHISLYVEMNIFGTRLSYQLWNKQGE